jgi:hypothetical protein
LSSPFRDFDHVSFLRPFRRAWERFGQEEPDVVLQ